MQKCWRTDSFKDPDRDTLPDSDNTTIGFQTEPQAELRAELQAEPQAEPQASPNLVPQADELLLGFDGSNDVALDYD